MGAQQPVETNETPEPVVVPGDMTTPDGSGENRPLEDYELHITPDPPPPAPESPAVP